MFKRLITFNLLFATWEIFIGEVAIIFPNFTAKKQQKGLNKIASDEFR
jgi:hypothetical protein